MSKILIITSGRTGSTNLSLGLSKNLNLKFIDEPFSPNQITKPYSYYFSKIKNCKNILVKHIWWHTMDNENPYEFLSSLINNFDIVFILSRNNIQEHYESLINLKYKSLTDKNVFGKYYFNDIPDEFIEEYKNRFTIDDLKKHKLFLEKISKDFNINLVYYENLYSDDVEFNYYTIKSIIPFLNDNIKKYLNNNNKQRSFVKFKQNIL